MFTDLGYDYDVEFYIRSEEEWDAHKEAITDLTKAVYEAHQLTKAI